MNKFWLMFADEQCTIVNGTSLYEQDRTSFPYQANVDATDTRYWAYYDALEPLGVTPFAGIDPPIR